MVPLLNVVADGMAFIGGFISVNLNIGMSSVLYFRKNFAGLDFLTFFLRYKNIFFRVYYWFW